MQKPTCAAARNDHDDSNSPRVIPEFIQILRQGVFAIAPRLDGLLDRIERMP